MSKYPYPIPSREEILGVLRTSAAPLAAHDIAEALSIKLQERESFFRRVAAMERDGQIRRDKRGHYQLTTHLSNFVAGRVHGHRDGYGFLIPDDGQDDLFLPNSEMQKVMHNDRVLARIVRYDHRGRPEGHVVEVTDRANKRVIGRLLNENGALIVAPEDKRISHDILISQNAKQAKVGQVVVVELTDFPSRHAQPLGRVTEVLGDINDPGMEIEIAVRKYGVPHEFSPAAVAASAALPDKVSPVDLRYRVDLRDVPLVTIDGEDARDFDDAVYCEPMKVDRGDGYRLVVAIADVSHYVKPGEVLDVDALERSTSVYFPRRVIPMLPEKLSNGLCSLNPAVDRCTLVCDMVVTSRGEVQGYQFYPAVIHSAARLTYTEVATLLSNSKGPEAARRAELLPYLQNLYGVFKALLGARQKRGAIDFDTTETYIICNAQGKIEQILPRQHNDAHKLIEECMLAANVCAADFMKRHKQPGLYRIHAGPTAEKLENLRSFLRGMGLTLGGSDTPHASDYAALMAKIRDRPDVQMLQPMLLRSMQQAVYSPDNIGHFGLAYDAYAHFTSPIRRYPDLLTHRSIYAILAGQKYVPKAPEGVELNTAIAPRARAIQKEDDARNHTCSNKAIWEELGRHCSANERRADEAARDVEAWLKCYFMRDKLGEEYSGMVNGVTPFGIFVQLDTLFIEALVHITELGSDYFQYDEIKNELRGERSGIRYRLSDRVRVQVSGVDLDVRKINFRLVHDMPMKVPRGAERVVAEHGSSCLRAMPPDITSNVDEPQARRKKPVANPSAPSGKETRLTHSVTKKKGGLTSKSPAKKARPLKKY
ncbi:MAG: ribonuclease R [Burkholderia sp.]|nr:MAG: Ribonuclease R [Burkholderia gladioli]